MSNTSDQIIQSWVDQTRSETPRYRRNTRSNIVTGQGQYAPIYSYGQHFELGRWVPATTDHRGFWLLNGDTYSVTTTRHQSTLRSAVNRTGDSVLILPYDTLGAAGIDRATILPVEITQDRWEPRTYPTAADLPRHYGDAGSLPYYVEQGDIIANTDGTYTLVRAIHRLGESVIAATYTAGRWDTAKPVRGHFLSGFDAQESRPHYFLAQLPAGSEPLSVKDAFELLRPEQVRAADSAGITVTRQGDVFAVPVPSQSTRDLTKLGARVKAGRLLGLSHVASEVIVADNGLTFARGTLTHRPIQSWRAPEHRRQRMGDGKTWHLIVKNTVPLDERGESRAWSKSGNVD